MHATRIIAIRHGETTWNVDGRIQGHLDIPLNDTGLWQAEQAAQALADESIAAIYSSDLQRAHVTAQAIARTSGAPLHATTGLRERCFGDFQGRTFKDVEAKDCIFRINRDIRFSKDKSPYKLMMSAVKSHEPAKH